jgi:hypothetical protein
MIENSASLCYYLIQIKVSLTEAYRKKMVSRFVEVLMEKAKVRRD